MVIIKSCVRKAKKMNDVGWSIEFVAPYTTLACLFAV